MLNWYKRILAQDKSLFGGPVNPLEGQKPGDPGYMGIGHSLYLGEDDYNRNDAVWIFDEGKLIIVTAAEWNQKGRDTDDFEHGMVFQEYSWPMFRGRYDADSNIISYVNRQTYRNPPSIILRQLEQQWPGARIIDFS